MPSEMKRLKQLEEENGRLKRIVADLSLDKSATIRFNRPFSSSSCFKRFISDGIRPPYFFFRLQDRRLTDPRLPTDSSTVVPSSPCRNANAIWLSLNLMPS